ncbi:MAG: NAD(P)/FAD-dependent oxidoreductase, partial [Gemmataceae bacterium]
PKDVDVAAWRGTPPLTRRPEAVAGPGWFAVGDATGYVEPFTGEGMAWALASGRAVVPIVQDSLNGWQSHHKDRWTRDHRRIIGQRQRLCRGIRKLLRFPTACDWAIRLLGIAPNLARPLVHHLNRPTPMLSSGVYR